jgi:hypothetical protein
VAVAAAAADRLVSGLEGSLSAEQNQKFKFSTKCYGMKTHP